MLGERIAPTSTRGRRFLLRGRDGHPTLGAISDKTAGMALGELVKATTAGGAAQKETVQKPP